MTAKGGLLSSAGVMLALPCILFGAACSTAPQEGATPTTSASAATGKVVTESRDLDPFKLTLAVGPAQVMYTGAEAAAQKPKHGYVTVFGGRSNIPPGQPAPGDHHIRLHVYDAVTTEVVANAQVFISITDPSGKVTAVPVITMQDILVGHRDFHYGNNVTLAPGSYTVEVTVNGQRATFRVAVE